MPNTTAAVVVNNVPTSRQGPVFKILIQKRYNAACVQKIAGRITGRRIHIQGKVFGPATRRGNDVAGFSDVAGDERLDVEGVGDALSQSGAVVAADRVAEDGIGKAARRRDVNLGVEGPAGVGVGNGSADDYHGQRGQGKVLNGCCAAENLHVGDNFGSVAVRARCYGVSSGRNIGQLVVAALIGDSGEGSSLYRSLRNWRRGGGVGNGS